MTKPHVKLFIPGPIEVYPEAFEAMSAPLVGHRSGDFTKLYRALQPKLQKLFYTADPVYLMTNSAWGAMEAAIRNCVNTGKVLCLGNGAFGDKWAEVAAACGKNVETLTWEWGTPVDPAAVEAKLSEGGYDALTIIHSETSVGMMNPVKEVMAVAKKFPNVVTIVDTVSSFSGVKIEKDAWGIDVMLTGTQKALALPPGMALISVSAKAMARAKETPGRGFYFDFLEFQSFHEQGLTPSTPALSLINGLVWRVDQIEKEGVENRYARHAAMNKLVVDWCESHGFGLFPQKGFGTVTMVCARNDKGVDLEAVNKKLKADAGMMINIGYGKLKGKTFRIATMGDETVESIKEMLAALEKAMGV